MDIDKHGKVITSVEAVVSVCIQKNNGDDSATSFAMVGALLPQKRPIKRAQLSGEQPIIITAPAEEQQKEGERVVGRYMQKQQSERLITAARRLRTGPYWVAPHCQRQGGNIRRVTDPCWQLAVRATPCSMEIYRCLTLGKASKGMPAKNSQPRSGTILPKNTWV